MAVEVYPHEKGTEISYLVIVLHFVNGYSVDTELGYKEQGRGETAFETEIDRSFLAVSGMLFVGSTGHNRSLSPQSWRGRPTDISPSRFVATPSLKTFIALLLLFLY